MKKWIALLLALLMLFMAAGCQSSEPENDRRDRDRHSDRKDQDEDDGDEEKAGPAFWDEDGWDEDGWDEETGDMPAGGFGETDCPDYEIRLVDRSWRNENGDILVSHTYEQVVLLGNTPQVEAINAQIAADCEAFFAPDNIRMYETEEEMEDYLEITGMGYDSLRCDAGARVTHQQDGILSIRIGTEWFMGGVFNVNYYGLTYDLNTGKALSLAQLMGLEGDALRQTLDPVILNYVNSEYGEGVLEDPVDVLAELQVEAYPFYVEDGQLILAFPTYTFAPGVAGPTVIPTGIRVGQ